MDRRHLLKAGAAAGITLGSGVIEGLKFGLPAGAGSVSRRPEGFGPLVPDPAGVLDLPEGFAYSVVSRAGQPLKGQPGGIVPGSQDGTASFEAQRGGVHLVINHEQGTSAPFPAVAAPELTYDPAALGGTSTLLLNRRNEPVSEYVSLAGTVSNCAGGLTPWGTWLTCEETEAKAGAVLTRDHGWVFEVSPYEPEANVTPTPLTGLGRFAHEAVVVDPHRGHLYLTEDASSPNGLLYRFTPAKLPNRLHSLRNGGLLEALFCPDAPDLSPFSELGTTLRATWLPVPDPAAATTSIRKQFATGAVTRSRKFEGLWWGNGRAYVVCSFARVSDGSVGEHDGQVWSYDPQRKKLTLEAYFPVNPDPSGTGAELPDGPDNITVNPWGGLVIAEDGEGVQHLVAIADGVPSMLARNAVSDSEFTGVNFSPDRKTLFANIQSDGLVFAVTGPWGRFCR